MLRFLRAATVAVACIACAPVAQAAHRHHHHYHHHHHLAYAHPSFAGRGAPAGVYGSDVLRDAARFVGDGNITGRAGPWCKWFVNMVLRQTGHFVQASGLARDARLLGPPTSAHVGAIAYLPWHTGFVAAVDWLHHRVLLLGGNQGHRVSYLWHSMYRMHFVEPS